MSKKMEKFLKNIFPQWSNVTIDYNWRGLIALSQKLTPSIGKIDNEEIYYGFGTLSNIGSFVLLFLRYSDWHDNPNSLESDKRSDKNPAKDGGGAN